MPKHNPTPTATRQGSYGDCPLNAPSTPSTPLNAELAALSGRAKSNLSRTLKTMERYGLVRLKKGDAGRIIPRVPYTDIVLGVPIAAPEPDVRYCQMLWTGRVRRRVVRSVLHP